MYRNRYAYRSPFNGPRAGALLAALIILFGQSVSAFHAPTLMTAHDAGHPSCAAVSASSDTGCSDTGCSDTGCSDTGCSDTGCSTAAHAEPRTDAASDAACTHAAAAPDADSCGDNPGCPAASGNAASEGCCDSDCQQDCRVCCLHVPLTSPLPNLPAPLSPAVQELGALPHPAIPTTESTPPFHPPRG